MATLNTDSKDSTADEKALTAEKCVTLYVLGKTGTHDNHHVGIEASPNGSDWVRVPDTLRGLGVKSFDICAARVRAVVIEAEGSTSTVDVHLIAR